MLLSRNCSGIIRERLTRILTLRTLFVSLLLLVLLLQITCRFWSEREHKTLLLFTLRMKNYNSNITTKKLYKKDILELFITILFLLCSLKSLKWSPVMSSYVHCHNCKQPFYREFHNSGVSFPRNSMIVNAVLFYFWTFSAFT